MTDNSVEGPAALQMQMPEFIEKSIRLVGPMDKADRICIFAYGLAAVPADVVSAYADFNSEKKITVVTSGRMPGWVIEGTDVIIVSCEGDDDRTVGIYREVKRRGCRIHCIATEGELRSLCECDSADVYNLPEGLVPDRMCGFVLGLLSAMVQNMGVCNIADSVEKTIPQVKKDRDELLKTDVGKFDYLRRGSVSFYGTSDIKPVVKRFAYNANGCLKRRSFYGEIPEFDHNELVGWCMTTLKLDEFNVVILTSEAYPIVSEIVKNMTETMVEYGRNPKIINIPYDNILRRNLYGIILADVVCNMLSRTVP